MELIILRVRQFGLYWFGSILSLTIRWPVSILDKRPCNVSSPVEWVLKDRSVHPLCRTTCLCPVTNTYSTPVCPLPPTHTHAHTYNFQTFPVFLELADSLQTINSTEHEYTKYFMYSSSQKPRALFFDDGAGQSTGPPRPPAVHRMFVDGAEERICCATLHELHVLWLMETHILQEIW